MSSIEESRFLAMINKNGLIFRLTAAATSLLDMRDKEENYHKPLLSSNRFWHPRDIHCQMQPLTRDQEEWPSIKTFLHKYVYQIMPTDSVREATDLTSKTKEDKLAAARSIEAFGLFPDFQNATGLLEACQYHRNRPCCAYHDNQMWRPRMISFPGDVEEID